MLLYRSVCLENNDRGWVRDGFKIVHKYFYNASLQLSSFVLFLVLFEKAACLV